MLTLAERLINQVCTVRERSTNSAVREKAIICLLDYMAAACAGTTSKTAHIAHEATKAFGQGQCTCIGQAAPKAMPCAVMYNGLIGHAEELDDSHRYVSGLHLGTVIIPAALAVAEEHDLSGKELVEALVAGHETAGRICRCLDKGHRARGFHSTGTVAPFGAAIAVASLLKLDKPSMVHALGITASSSAGLFAFLENGATVKHYHAGRAAFDGYMAAHLAKAGMTGPANIFEAREGFFKAYAEDHTAEFLDKVLPHTELECSYHKLHSSCGHAFPAIDAALALRKFCAEQGLAPDLIDTIESISNIDIGTYHAAAVLNNMQPQTIAQARFSVPFMLAMAFVFGHISRHDISKALEDERVRRLCAKVTLREDAALSQAFPAQRAGVLQASFSSGEQVTFKIDAPRGMPENPVTIDEIVLKLRVEALPLLGEQSLYQLVKTIQNIETVSVRDIMHHVRHTV